MCEIVRRFTVGVWWVRDLLRQKAIGTNDRISFEETHGGVALDVAERQTRRTWCSGPNSASPMVGLGVKQLVELFGTYKIVLSSFRTFFLAHWHTFQPFGLCQAPATHLLVIYLIKSEVGSNLIVTPSSSTWGSFMLWFSYYSWWLLPSRWLGAMEEYWSKLVILLWPHSELLWGCWQSLSTNF